MFKQEKGYSLLGKGAQAVVISVEMNDGQKMAIKKPVHPIKKIQSSSGIINMKELYILSNIKHPYIQSADYIFFKDPFETHNSLLELETTFDRVFFGMKAAEYSLYEFIYKKTSVVSYTKRAMFQTACAVQYLHGKGICHRDIKPGNILCFFKEGVLTCRLTDFGMTKPLNSVAQNSLHAGTTYYRAPELIMENKNYGYSMDIWSLGCTFAEMFKRKPLFVADNQIQLLITIFKIRGTPTEKTMREIGSKDFKIEVPYYKGEPIYKMLELTPTQIETFNTKDDVYNGMHNPGTLEELCNLLNSMLQVDPRHRLNMDEVLLHDFFKGHFEDHPAQHNLWKPDKNTLTVEYREKQFGNSMLYYPSNHSSNMWDVGLQEISFMEEPHDFYTTEISYSIRFMAIDIYNRVLMKIKPEKSKEMYMKLAWSSTYIASKFYLDNGSVHLWDLFPASPSYMNSVEIQNSEKRIIELLECEIYRPNLFTFIKDPCFYSALYALAMYPEYIYGKNLIEIMTKFNKGVQTHKHDNPGMAYPL